MTKHNKGFYKIVYIKLYKYMAKREFNKQKE